MFLVSYCICLCPVYWSHVLSWEWRCSWSSADRRCSNDIWMIKNLIAHKGASYIRDLTVQSKGWVLLKFHGNLCTYSGLDAYFFPMLAVGQPSNNMDLSEIEIYLGMMIIQFFFLFFVYNENIANRGELWSFVCLLFTSGLHAVT